LTLNMSIQGENGREGEYLAAKWLNRQGYEIHAINWKSSHQEIYIIATNCHFWVFVEVKTKTTSNILQPENAVNSEKQKNMIKAARRFMSKTNDIKKIRFDVISVFFVSHGIQMLHFKDAFFPIIRNNVHRNPIGFL